MAKHGGRLNEASRSMALGAKDPRNHRQPQSATSDRDLQVPIYEQGGKIAIRLGGALDVDNNGAAFVQVKNGVMVDTGSPMSVQLDIGDDSLELHDNSVVARPSTSQVRIDSREINSADLKHALDVEIELVKRKDVALGYPGLDASGYITALPADPELLAIAGLTSAADKGIQFTGSGTAATYDLTTAGKALLDDANAAAQRTTLGLGALAIKGTIATADIDADAVTYAKMQNVSATDKLLGRSTAGAGDVEEIPCTSTARSLLDDASTSAMLTTLGAFPAAWHIFARITSDVTTTSNSAGDVTGIAFAVAANEAWAFEAHLMTKCSTANGHKWAVNIPTSCTIAASLRGSRATVASIISDDIVADDTLSGTIGTGSYATGGWVDIIGTVDNGANAGTIQVRFAAATAGDTLTAKAQSYIRAWRIS